jgi:cytochrome c biogenesis protein CcdA
VFRSIVILVIDAVLALPRLSFMLAVYFWTRVLDADDPALARRRAVRWTWITLLCGAAMVMLGVVMANVVKW